MNAVGIAPATDSTFTIAPPPFVAEDGREAPNHVERAEVVDFHLAPGHLRVLGQHEPVAAVQTGVVDHHGDVRAGRDRRGDRIRDR